MDQSVAELMAKLKGYNIIGRVEKCGIVTGQ
jgi:hypothetical protein